MTITVEAPTRISIEAMQQGSEADGSATIFTLNRTENTASPLDVNVILQGTAQPNIDYTAPVGLGMNNTLTVTFDAGSDTALLSLQTLSDNVIDSYESVLAILQPGTGYSMQAGGDRAEAEEVTVAVDTALPFNRGRVAGSVLDRILDNGNFATLNGAGGISVWGESGTDSSLTQDTPTESGYTQIYSNHSAFCALHTDGSVTAWGNSAYGGSLGALESELSSDVVQIVPTKGTFSAFKSDGSVVNWGTFYAGFYGTTYPPDEIDGVKKVATTYDAVAVVTEDGRIHAWGGNIDGGGFGGGDDASPGWNSPEDTGYIDITGSFATFAALRQDGSIRTWGGGPAGWWTPDNSSTRNTPTDSGYTQIVANGARATSFAAMKADGSITSWGVINHVPPGAGYTQIIAAEDSFTAIRADGSLYSWDAAGAISFAPSGNDFTQVVANSAAYAAIKTDGTLVTWGNAAAGGDGAVASLTNVVDVGVMQITVAIVRLSRAV